MCVKLTSKSCCLLLTVLAAITSQLRAEHVVIVNLTNEPAYVAKRYYVAESSSAGGGDNTSKLYVYTYAGWQFSGWQKIEPGGSLVANEQQFYVEQEGEQVTWANKKTKRGLIHPTKKFSEKVEKQSKDADIRRLLEEGHEWVDFQHLKPGIYRIDGNAYRLRSMNFDFNFSSRDPKSFSRTYRVPGRVAYYDEHYESSNASDVSFKRTGDGVRLSGITEGWRQFPWQAREPGYFRGGIRIFYTERR